MRFDLAVGDHRAKQLAQTRAPQMKRQRGAHARVSIDDGTDRPAGTNLFQQGDDALERDDRDVDIGAALESSRRFGLEDRAVCSCVEPKPALKYALSNATTCVAEDTSDVAPPITPRHRLRAIMVGDDEHLRILELPFHTVESRQCLGGACSTNANLVTGPVSRGRRHGGDGPVR